VRHELAFNVNRLAELSLSSLSMATMGVKHMLSTGPPWYTLTSMLSREGTFEHGPGSL
jgi:hypothetical protein